MYNESRGLSAFSFYVSVCEVAVYLNICITHNNNYKTKTKSEAVSALRRVLGRMVSVSTS